MATGTSSGSAQMVATPFSVPLADIEHLLSSPLGEVARRVGGAEVKSALRLPSVGFADTSPSGENEENETFTPLPRAYCVPRGLPILFANWMFGWKGSLAPPLLYIRGNWWPSLNAQW